MMKTQSGMGLSEVLISLFLASLITLLCSELYLGCKKYYLAIEQHLEARLEMQWVSDLVTHSIRRAGFTPCMGIENLDSTDRRRFGAKLYALKMETFPHPLLQINRMSELFSTVQSIHQNSEIKVSLGGDFKEGRSVLIADCYHAEAHHILTLTPTKQGFSILLDSPLIYTYEPPVYFGEWLEEKWFIKPNMEHKNTLHYQLIQTEELTPWVDTMDFKKEQRGGKQWIHGVLRSLHEGDLELVAAVRGS